MREPAIENTPSSALVQYDRESILTHGELTSTTVYYTAPETAYYTAQDSAITHVTNIRDLYETFSDLDLTPRLRQVSQHAIARGGNAEVREASVDGYEQKVKSRGLIWLLFAHDSRSPSRFFLPITSMQRSPAYAGPFSSGISLTVVRSGSDARLRSGGSSPPVSHTATYCH